MRLKELEFARKATSCFATHQEIEELNELEKVSGKIWMEFRMSFEISKFLRIPNGFLINNT